MASSNGPYYEKLNRVTASSNGLYPDGPAPSAMMYSMADGALQIHRETASHHLAGLVEAASAVSGQDTPVPSDLHAIGSGCSATSASTNNTTNRKRKRHGEPATSYQQSSHPEDYRWSTTDQLTEQQAQQQDSNEKSPGSQSAAALFRNPATTTKRHTRPPMSKLFTSLELDPENFLHLQTAAKTYMLDPNHPERRDCVGQRGKGDSEAVKLKLWNTAARFLDEEGHGNSHFGEQVVGEQGSSRTMIWPQDKSTIIGAVIPLLRRMVTNERQRQYAVETRKGGLAMHEKSSNLSESQPSISDGEQDQVILQGPPQSSTPSNEPCMGTSRYDENLRLRFNVVRNGRRLRPTYDLLARDCPDFQTVVLRVLSHVDGMSQDDLRIRVLLPTGLVRIQDNGSWVKALYSISEAEWMDDEMKVLVEV